MLINISHITGPRIRFDFETFPVVSGDVVDTRVRVVCVFSFFSIFKHSTRHAVAGSRTRTTFTLLGLERSVWW